MDVDTGEGSSSRQPPDVDFDQSLTSLLDSSSWKFRAPPPPPPQDPGVPTTEDFVEVDVEMEDEFAMTIGQCGFDFFKIPPVQKRHCWLSVNGSPWARSFGTQANWTNRLVIDLGRMAKPKVKIIVRTNKEFDGRIVASEKEGEVHDFSIHIHRGISRSQESPTVSQHELSLIKRSGCTRGPTRTSLMLDTVQPPQAAHQAQLAQAVREG